MSLHKTTLFVDNLCCADEQRCIEDRLITLPGVDRVVPGARLGAGWACVMLALFSPAAGLPRPRPRSWRLSVVRAPVSTRSFAWRGRGDEKGVRPSSLPPHRHGTAERRRDGPAGGRGAKTPTAWA